MIRFLQLLLSHRSTMSGRVTQAKVDPAEACAAHLYLANRHVTMGQNEQAEVGYLRAYELQPSPEIADLIANLRFRRLAQKRASTVIANTRVRRAA